MTQQQSDALTAALQKFLAAEAANVQAQAAARKAYADYQASQVNATVTVPAANAAALLAANNAFFAAQDAYTNAANAGQAAQVAQSQAQVDLTAATLASLQTGAVEAV